MWRRGAGPQPAWLIRFYATHMVEDAHTFDYHVAPALHGKNKSVWSTAHPPPCLPIPKSALRRKRVQRHTSSTLLAGAPLCCREAFAAAAAKRCTEGKESASAAGRDAYRKVWCFSWLTLYNQLCIQLRQAWRIQASACVPSCVTDFDGAEVLDTKQCHALPYVPPQKLPVRSHFQRAPPPLMDATGVQARIEGCK